MINLSFNIYLSIQYWFLFTKHTKMQVWANHTSNLKFKVYLSIIDFISPSQ